MYFPWKGKKILIFGLGVLGGGVGVAKFFAENGAKVTVTDLKTKEELTTSVAGLKKYDIEFILGGHRDDDFKKTDLIIKNPAVRSDSPYLKLAKKYNVPVMMESSVFFKLCPSKNIIGVTGTKGKTTTASLIFNMLKISRMPTQFAGGPQTSMLDKLLQITKNTFVVLELSSWQLSGLAPFAISPKVGVVTNIYPDHLNYYKSMDEYITDKSIIFKYQKKGDLFITNFDNRITKDLAKKAQGRLIFFSPKKLAIWEKEEKTFTKFKRNDLETVFEKGEHNLANFLASLAVGIGLNLPIFSSAIWKALINFNLPKGRIELIREIDGVKFYNDTTATTPEATIAALNTLKAPIILICGGADKGLDYKQFVKEAKKKAKRVILLEGTATNKMERELDHSVIRRFSNFKKAVFAAKKLAKSGDAILLSPAAASFGMFKNEFDRGEQFKEIVRRL